MDYELLYKFSILLESMLRGDCNRRFLGKSIGFRVFLRESLELHQKALIG